jgi:MFS family permease
MSAGHVHPRVATRTPQFWLLWGVLCLNVTAGIGVIGMASPMLQEVFGGRLLGRDAAFEALTTAERSEIATIAAGFTGLLSLFNIGGRLFWSSLSDRIGRRATYSVFFILGFLLYVAAPLTGRAGLVGSFVAMLCLILSMYGGGFATIPAYLADLFGTQMVGAIHGRLLTAWSAAGIFGPVVVNYLREYQLAQGVSRARVYDVTLYVLGASLLVGLVLNLRVRPVATRHQMSEAELEGLRGGVTPAIPTPPSPLPAPAPSQARRRFLRASAWLVVGLPLLLGTVVTLQKAAVLLR